MNSHCLKLKVSFHPLFVLISFELTFLRIVYPTTLLTVFLPLCHSSVPPAVSSDSSSVSQCTVVLRRGTLQAVDCYSSLLLSFRE
jgi:hypothetical protein